jgi:hypothetical protein
VELYEQIRREYEHGAVTIRAVARKLGVHRREVRKAPVSAMPVDRKIPDRERPSRRRRFHSSMGFWSPTARLPESSCTRRTGFGHDCAVRCPKWMWPNQRCDSMCGQERRPWVYLGQETFVVQSYTWGG